MNRVSYVSREEIMKKLLPMLMVLSMVACLKQTVNTDMTFYENRTFDEVWNASVRALDDIDFTIDSVDRETGFIAAERGRHTLQNAPPRLSIMIDDLGDKISVRCRMLQKEQYIDIFGFGRKTVRDFLTALNMNLNRSY